MSLSFTPSRPAVGLWWAIAWRTLVCSLLLLVPMVALVFVIQLPMVFGLPLAYMTSPYLGIAVSVLFVLVNLALQWFLLPVIVYAAVFRWLLGRGRFGRNAIAGTYRGAPVKTLRTAFHFSLWFFLENFKYVWPLFIGGALVGFTADKTTGEIPPHVAQLVFAFLPLSIYLYMLVLTDLIRRRRFSRLELVVTPLKATSAAPQPLDIAPAAPAKSKPAAKPVAKPAAKPAAKASVKPVAKPKLVAKAAVKTKAKPKPKAKK